MSTLPVESPNRPCRKGGLCVLFRRLWQAFGLLFEYLALLGGLILVGVLPWALVTVYLSPESEPQSPRGLSAFLVAGLVGFVTKTLARGALAYALAHIQHDREVRLNEAVRVALRHWFRLLIARGTATVIVFLGLLAGIVPGIYLVFRYAFITEAVMLEDARPRAARYRSWELSQGQVVPILGIYLLADGLGYLLAAPFTVLHWASGVNVALTWVLVVCITSVLSGMGPIALFLLYWKSRSDELGHAPAAPGTGVQP